MVSRILALALTVFASDLCDLTLDGAICLFDGQTNLLPRAQPEGLVGHWSFDDNSGLDYSHKRHHATTKPVASGAYSGRGASAKFTGHDYLEVSPSTDFDVKLFTVSFWAYIFGQSSDSGRRWCPLMQKGLEDDSVQSYNRTPSIHYDRNDRGLRAYVSTTDSVDFPMGEYVESNARLPKNRWAHIAVVRTEKRIKLYVNGILDAVNATQGWTQLNENGIYIGGVPWLSDECQFPFLLDEMRYYSTALNDDFIEAEATGALGGLESAYVKLGCINCNYTKAEGACKDNYQLCASIELNSGGYQVARANGWTDWNSHLWSSSVNNTDSSEEGLGLCCRKLNP
jgi:hypothetical protein